MANATPTPQPVVAYGVSQNLIVEAVMAVLLACVAVAVIFALSRLWRRER